MLTDLSSWPPLPWSCPYRLQPRPGDVACCTLEDILWSTRLEVLVGFAVEFSVRGWQWKQEFELERCGWLTT